MQFDEKSEFDEKNARLKHELKVKNDKEIAEFFGIAQNTYSERRKRNSFPDKKLIEIVAANKKKWYWLDVHWVLTGKTETEYFTEKRGNPMLKLQFESMLKKANNQLSRLSSSQQLIIFDLINSMDIERARSKFFESKASDSENLDE